MRATTVGIYNGLAVLSERRNILRTPTPCLNATNDAARLGGDPFAPPFLVFAHEMTPSMRLRGNIQPVQMLQSDPHQGELFKRIRGLGALPPKECLPIADCG